MITTRINIEGKNYVLLPEKEFRQLAKKAAMKLPPLPQPDRRGNRPAAATAKAVLSRSIMRQRLDAGLEQQELARLAGMRPETISRIEAGTNRPRRETIERIEAALAKAMRNKPRRK